MRLEPDTTVAFSTDGVIERRGAPATIEGRLTVVVAPARLAVGFAAGGIGLTALQCARG
jgi:hypothetical protein